jgi:hypothetical protein
MWSRSQNSRENYIDFLKEIFYPYSFAGHAKTPAVGAYSITGALHRLLEYHQRK